MRHGRDHQRRELHVRNTRTRSTPDSSDWETKLFTSGRKRGVPPEGLVGSHTQRRIPTPPDIETSRDRDDEPVSGGSDVAPTAKAERRERDRHARERAAGRVAAGTEGRLRDQRRPDVDRATLDKAARDADRSVGARPPTRPR